MNFAWLSSALSCIWVILQQTPANKVNKNQSLVRAEFSQFCFRSNFEPGGRRFESVRARNQFKDLSNPKYPAGCSRRVIVGLLSTTAPIPVRSVWRRSLGAPVPNAHTEAGGVAKAGLRLAPVHPNGRRGSLKCAVRHSF